MAGGFVEALRADLVVNAGGDPHTPVPKLLARVLVSTHLRACALIRLAAGAPAWTRPLWRNLLITLHSIDVSPGAVIEPGLWIRHPFGIVIGPNARIEPRVSLSHNITLASRDAEGRHSDAPIVLEEACEIFTTTTVLAGVTIGAGAIIGSHCLITRDVEPGAVVRAHSTH
jgi:serine acetyltransferase